MNLLFVSSMSTNVWIILLIRVCIGIRGPVNLLSGDVCPPYQTKFILGTCNIARDHTCDATGYKNMCAGYFFEVTLDFRFQYFGFL